MDRSNSDLTKAESELLRFLLAPPELEDFRRQLSACTATRSRDGQLYFHDATPANVRAQSSTNPIAEARYRDSDGIFVSYLLFQRDGALYFLDILKDAPVPIIKRFPPLSELERTPPGPRTS